jgi:curved DNA-binding protein CbpA
VEKPFDPYAALGVERDADAATIRAAFRAKTKTEHPDAGGDKERFEDIKRAETLLLDPERRAHYDRTGEATEKPPIVNPDGPALVIISRLMGALFAEAIDPNENDFVSVMMLALDKELAKIRKHIVDFPMNIATVKEISGRFSRRDGEPDERIKSVLDWHVRQIEEMERKARQSKIDHERARAILSEYRFDTRTQTSMNNLLKPYAGAFR